MTRTPYRLLQIAALTIASTLALAQPAPPSSAPAGNPAHSRPGNRTDLASIAERHARRMAYLKNQLKITSEQESAWTAYATALQPPTQLPPLLRDDFDQLSAPERMDLLEKHRIESDARMKQYIDAAIAFYGQLTPKQKKVFDALGEPRWPAQSRTPRPW
ncbi:MAG: Spy/CpxP family protein refolding chaperone [Desulfovibrionaceae bacterium]|jgi:Spy/CpxP family protein refolding chaperone|nr:Spy/CpxP family protein refolding chaperone [Desulfovibrionaceae bacterium]